MEKTEYLILKKRDYFRKRRNIIRRILLSLFTILFIYLGYKVYLIPKHSKLQIEVIGNNLINPSFVVKYVSEKINNENFFLISPRKISNNLLDFMPLIKNAAIRKYLLPSYKLSIYLKEKDIWGKVYKTSTDQSSSFLLVTVDGDVINLQNLDLSLLTVKTLPVYISSKLVLNKKDFLLLKDVYFLLRDTFHISIAKFLISDLLELEIYPHDKFRIKVGKIDEDLTKRVAKIKPVLDVINKKSYLIEYLDLTLDGGAIFKKYSSDKKGKGFSFFKKREN